MNFQAPYLTTLSIAKIMYHRW